MKKLLTGKEGLTLIELIVVIAIIGILGTVITRMFLTTTVMYTKGNELETVRSNATVAMEVIRNELTFVTDPEILDISGNDYPEGGKAYLYVDSDENSETYGHLMRSGSELFSQDGLGRYRYEIQFRAGSSGILVITLLVLDGDEEKTSMETSVDLVNAESISGPVSGGNAIGYNTQ